MNRTAWAIVALLVLVASTGCVSLFPGDVDRDTLEESIDYEWNTSADVTITVTGDRYEAVYAVENRSTLRIYRIERFNNERSFDPIGARFRYPDGRVVGPEAMQFEKRREAVTVELPANEGQFAYSAPKQGKELRLAVLVEDASYEVVLPRNARVEYPLLGHVVPPGYETTTADGQVHINWAADEVTTEQVIVRYYLVRDLYIFGALFGTSVIVALGGITWYWLQLRAARRRREMVGLDVESGDE